MRLREFQAPVLVVVESLHNPGLLNLICQTHVDSREVLDVADMDITEVCSLISDVNVNEEP